jgi:hypothetical protein
MTSDEVRWREAAIDRALREDAMEQAEGHARDYLNAAGVGHTIGAPARAPWFRAAYLAAQVSLAAGRLGEAGERVAPCLDVVERLPGELAARVRLLAAEALARLRRGPEARPLLERVPSDLLTSRPLLWVRALRVRLWLGELAHLGEQLADCGAALGARGDVPNGALLLCEEGRAWESAGGLDQAERCWRRAEALTRGCGADRIRADVLLQLGRLDHLRGRLPSALDRYDEALAGAGDGPHALEVRLRRLLVLLDANQGPRARAVADELLAEPVERLPEEVRPLAGLVGGLLQGEAPPGAPYDQQAYAAAARGDAAAARLLYHRALASEASPERQARLALALGLLALTQGDGPDAASWLRRAEELARRGNLPDVLWRALEGRGRLAAELDGDEGAAEPLFEEAVLVSEVQAGQFTHRSDAALYRQQRAGALRQLLHAACRRGDAAAVFRHQELDRGRLLLDLWRGAADRAGLGDLFDGPDVTGLEREVATCEEALRGTGGEERQALLRRREGLKVQLDHLWLDFLRDRSRRGTSALPTIPGLDGLQRSLPPGALYVAPVLCDEELYLLAAWRGGRPRVIRARVSAAGLVEALAALRDCLAGQITRYQAGLPLGRSQRAELDARLDDLGRGPLGDALAQALAAPTPPPRQLLWAPEGVLHGLPIHALRPDGHYLIEHVAVVQTFGGALVVHQAQRGGRARRRFGPALVVTERPEVLPEAAREGAGVAASFLWARTLHGPAATRRAVLRGLARARAVHFACHAHFDREHPLAARVALPSGETLGALEWLGGLVDNLPLVALSACRSAEVAPLLGQEVFGLVTGVLGGGVRAVLAGLWPVADQEVVPLMWRFYRHRLTEDLATALALAQREYLAAPDGSPLFWAAFTLFGDSSALPPPGPWGRWLARWRQARHARRFREMTH